MIVHGEIVQQNHIFSHLLLSACSRSRSLKATKLLHALTITSGSVPNAPNIFVHNNLISQYASLNELSLARNLFDKIPQRNTVSYNTLIASYSRCGYVKEASNLFFQMRDCGIMLTQFTFGGLLSSESLNLSQGIQLHALIEKNGLLQADAFCGTALIGLYGRNGCLKEASQVFEDMPQKNLVTWNSMLSLYGKYELVQDCMNLFHVLVCMKASLSECSFVGVLSGFSCAQDLQCGEQIHCLVIKTGHDSKVLVVNCLLNMYVKCGGVFVAEKVFDKVHVHDVVTWNTIIGAMVKNFKPIKALELFCKMSLSRDFRPIQSTYVSVINSCASLEDPMYGEFIHGNVIRAGFEADVFVGSALVDFYAKFSKLEDAHFCFDEISEKNVVSWNSLILGYSNNCSSTSMYLLQEMFHLGYRPNEFTFSAVLKPSSLIEVKQLHGLIIKIAYEDNEYVLSSLVSSYAKNGLISDATVCVTWSDTQLPIVPSNIIAGVYSKMGQFNETLKMLSLLEKPDIVSWNIAIAACARQNDYEQVFKLLKHMHNVQLFPDNYTFVSVLSSCAQICNLNLGCSVHCLILKTGHGFWDTFVCNVLIDMYGKCGDIFSAVKTFDGVEDRNLITWTALISALGVNGYAEEALLRFREMELQGFKLDGVCFISVLTACRHGGLVKEGIELFEEMRKRHGVEPEMDHFHCIVDLLARHGHLKEAEKIISSMPFLPNARLWRSFLEGCKRQSILEEKLEFRLDSLGHKQTDLSLIP